MQANLFKSMHTCTCTCVFYIVSNYMYMRVHAGTVHVATALTCSWHSIVPCLYSTLIGVVRSKDLVVSCMDGFNFNIFAYGQTGYVNNGGKCHVKLHDKYEKAVYTYTCILYLYL